MTLNELTESVQDKQVSKLLVLLVHIKWTMVEENEPESSNMFKIMVPYIKQAYPTIDVESVWKELGW